MSWLSDPGGTLSNAWDHASDQVSNLTDQAKSWWEKNKPKPYHTAGYTIDASKFSDPNAAANKAGWAAGANAAEGRQSSFRGGQQDLIAALQASANGTGPSIADEQSKQNLERNISSAAALQASARGMNPALAARGVQDAAGRLATESNANSVLARMQEQQMARGQLSDALMAGRSADAQQNSVNDARANYLTGLGATSDYNSLNAGIAGEQLQVQNQLGTDQINAGGDAANKAWMGQLGGAGLAAGGAAIASDERKKTNVKDGSLSLEDMLAKLAPVDFDYKDPSAPGAAAGPQTGVMAQDLQKSKAGSALVTDTPSGKMVDGARAGTTALAAAADLQKRVKTLEEALAAKHAQPGDAATKARLSPDRTGYVPETPAPRSKGGQLIDWLMEQQNLGGIGKPRSYSTAGNNG